MAVNGGTGEASSRALGDLDQVAAGVVEQGDCHRPHLRRPGAELHTELLQPFVLRVDVVDGKADPSDAASWFREPAEKGEARSQLALAKMYSSGTGVARDLERAFFWSIVAAASLDDAGRKEAERITRPVAAANRAEDARQDEDPGRRLEALALVAPLPEKRSSGASGRAG